MFYFVLLCSTLFFSCAGDLSKVPDEQVSYKDFAHSVALQHNAVIMDLHKNDKVLPLVPGESMDDFCLKNIPNITLALRKDSKYVNAKINADLLISVLDRNKANLKIGENTKVDFISYSSMFISDLKQRGEISSYMELELTELCLKSVEMSADEMVDYLQNDFAKDATMPSDLKAKYLMIEVGIASNDLWSKTNGRIALKPGSSTVIADGIGALYGSLLGAAGSIIYGAAFSLYENEIL